MSLPTLYQRDSKGKIRQWEVWTNGAAIIVEHGVMGGKLQQKHTVAKPKNVGRANETTAEQQAILEARSKWMAQVDRDDYNECVDLAGLQTRAMLAGDYHKVGHRMNWEDTVGQPKLDGMRLTTGYRFRDRRGDFEMLTRKGEVFNVDHLMNPAQTLRVMVNEQLDELGYGPNRCVALDGEVYLHGKTLNWISSRAKKYYPGETETLEYHLFDIVADYIPFRVRYEVLEECFRNMQEHDIHGNMTMVPLIPVTEDNFLEVHGQLVEDGYEGLILRHNSGLYKYGTGNTRSPDLFKYKVFKDEECLITNVWEDDNNNAMWTVRRKPTLNFGANVVVNVTPKRSHAERKQMLLEPEKWIGQWVTVKYQGETPDGSLQFPTGRELRKCDELGEPLE